MPSAFCQRCEAVSHSLRASQKSSRPTITTIHFGRRMRYLNMRSQKPALNSQAAARNSSTKTAGAPASCRRSRTGMELSLLFRGQSRYFCGAMNRIFMAVLFLALALGRAAAEKILFAEDFSRGLSNGWQNVAFFKTPTDYQACREGTNFYLRGFADKSCSALSTKLD